MNAHIPASRLESTLGSTPAQTHRAHRARALLTAGVATVTALFSSLAASDVPSLNAQFIDSPKLYVVSDGKRYTQMSRKQHPIAPLFRAKVQVTTAVRGGRVDSWGLALQLKAFGKVWGHDLRDNRPPESGMGVHLEDYTKKRRSDRPDGYTGVVALSPAVARLNSFVTGLCENRREQLLALGQSNEQIFAKNQGFLISPTYSSRTSGKEGSGKHFVSTLGPNQKVEVVCMKRAQGAAAPVNTGFDTVASVVQSNLVVQERSSAAGNCQIELSSVIQTDRPNMLVKFRYEHTNGRKSEVKSITTNHAKTAMFTHTYDVPNEPGQESQGSVRIVGVAPKFSSNWQTYSMNCRQPGASGFRAATKPKVTIKVIPTANRVIDGQLCPTQVRLEATLTAEQRFSGTGAFVGNSLAQIHQQAITINKHMSSQHVWTRPLNAWNQGAATPGSLAGNSGASNATIKSQRFVLGYNLMSEGGKIVFQKPKKTISIACKIVDAAGEQSAPGGFAAPSNTNAEPVVRQRRATTEKRLKPTQAQPIIMKEKR